MKNDTLSLQTTLSGGEAQRIKLVAELTKGRANIRNMGITADDRKGVQALNKNLYLIDIGPEAGEEGGTIVAQGKPQQVVKNKTSRTAPFIKKA